MRLNGLDEYWVPEHVKDYLRKLGFVLPLDDMEPEAEGMVEAQCMVSWDDKSISTRAFMIRVEPVPLVAHDGLRGLLLGAAHQRDLGPAVLLQLPVFGQRQRDGLVERQHELHVHAHRQGRAGGIPDGGLGSYGCLYCP